MLNSLECLFYRLTFFCDPGAMCCVIIKEMPKSAHVWKFILYFFFLRGWSSAVTVWTLPKCCRRKAYASAYATSNWILDDHQGIGQNQIFTFHIGIKQKEKGIPFVYIFFKKRVVYTIGDSNSVYGSIITEIQSITLTEDLKSIKKTHSISTTSTTTHSKRQVNFLNLWHIFTKTISAILTCFHNYFKTLLDWCPSVTSICGSPIQTILKIP